MRKLVIVGMLALAVGCAGRKEGPAPEASPSPPLVHRIDWSGQTLEQIAGWYTGKKANWEKLVKPVNPDLERCCVPLKVGREVVVPSTLLVTADPMPKPAPATKARAAAAKAAKSTARPEPATGPSDAEAEESTSDEPVADPEPLAERAPAPPPPLEPKGSGPASGKVMFKGGSWKVADAIAYPDDQDVAIALSSEPFNRKEMGKDGKFDSFDVMRHDGSSLTLKVDEDGSLGCVNFSTQTGGGSSCNTAISEGFKLSSRSAEKIAGRLAFTDGEDDVDVRFDVPVVAKLERGGTPLASGGGEAGEAVLANFAAIQAGDYDKAVALSHPEKREMMEQNAAESKEMFEMLKMMTPTDVKILGGRVDGDTAVLDFEGKSDGLPVKGTIDAEKYEGKWYLDSVNTTH